MEPDPKTNIWYIQILQIQDGASDRAYCITINQATPICNSIHNFIEIVLHSRCKRAIVANKTDTVIETL
jgi:hypothetical protein